jgi:glucokinase
VILAGDIGGTNSRLAFFERTELGQPRIQAKYPSRDHSGLHEIVADFVGKHRLSIAAACVAGAVRNGRCEATNLPWVIDARDLAICLGIDHVWVINDLEANAHGLSSLEADDFCVLAEGAKDASGNAAVISAGTGLGEAGLYWDGRAYQPFAGEGGHTSFAPSDALQVELFYWLEKQFGRHVSWERVVSGPGLVNLYRFLKETGRGEEPGWLTEALGQGDPAAVISQAASAGRSPLCAQALDLFVTLYGAEAGDLALKMMATGGVFVGGGIAPKNLPKMKDGSFLAAFHGKGRMKELLEAMPVRVILNDQTALLGSARCAAVRGGLI